MTDNGTKQPDAWYLSVDGGQTWYRISGEDGEDGNRGPTGPQGPTGPTGPAGANGQPGDSMFSKKPTLSDDGTHYIFTLADDDDDDTNNPTIEVAAYQPLRILTAAEHEAGTPSGNGMVPVTPGGQTTLYLQLSADADYANITATVTPLGDDAVLTRATPDGWSAALQRTDDGQDITITVTAPAAVGKALLDVSLIRTDGSKQTASRVLEVPVVEGGQTLTEAGTYIMQGTYTQGITISGKEDITLVLEGANITTTDASAIRITDGATPTLRVVGENSVSVNYNQPGYFFSGIYVASGSSITLTGDGPDNVLRVTAQFGAGIGGFDSTPCGDITISGITVEAVGGTGYASAPGIGSVNGSCGTITITDATVYARGRGASVNAAPAIGAYGSVPNIVISRSEIHTYRGFRNNQLNPDYIGQGVIGLLNQGSGLIRGDIKSSTVYKYTYDYGTNTSTEDGIVDYDDQGVGTERPRP